MPSPDDTERVSVCCGAPEHPDVPEFCSACNEGTGFETAAEPWTWNVGDRVQRRLDVFEDESQMRHGVVSRRYSGYSTRFGSYSELYDVRWDDSCTQHAFLSHGLEAEQPQSGDLDRRDDWPRTYVDVGLDREREGTP